MKKFFLLVIATCGFLPLAGDITEPKHPWEMSEQYHEVVIKCPDGSFCKRTYYAGFLDGATTFTFPNSLVIEKEIIYSRGQVIKETVYYPQGFARKETVYNQKDHTEVTQWYANGALKCVEKWAGSLLAKAQYYDNEGTPLSEVDECSWIHVKHEKYGHLAKDGSRILTTYYSNNSPKEVTPYKEGVAEGIRKTYTPEGVPLAHETWRGGKQHGMTTLFTNGEKSEDIPYVDGLKNGKGFRYENGTTIVAETHWEDDQLHGMCRSLHCGTVKTDWYYKGQKVTQGYYESQLCQVIPIELTSSGRYKGTLCP